jgi:hypothetical protein
MTCKRSVSLLGLLTIVLLLLGVAQPVGAAPIIRGPGTICGPGLHWVDTCPSGTDVIHNSVKSGGRVMFDPEDGGLIIDLPPMVGEAAIFRGPGTTVPDHHIDTEMVSLLLIGGGLTLRAGDGTPNLSCDGPLCTFGRITELPTDPSLALSFFDVFFELSPTPFGPLHNAHADANPVDARLGLGNQPCSMQAIIDMVPPDILTGSYQGCYDRTGLPPTELSITLIDIDLYDANGVHRAIFTDAPVTHSCGTSTGPADCIITITDIPEPSTLLLLGSGLAGILGLGIRRRLQQG